MWARPAAAAALLLLRRAACDEHTHQYADGDPVAVYGNKIGPYHNPLETYGYFDVLPWCPPRSMQAKPPSLGEALSGDELIKLAIDVRFRKNVARTPICVKAMSREEGATMRRAISEQYWYQLYIDELPMWAALGKQRRGAGGHVKGATVLYLHQRFSLGYNGDRLVVANLTAEDPREIPDGGGDFEFTYSVDWVESSVPFAGRFRRYLDESFFEHKIHWFAVCNSFMMVFFLLGLVFTILVRTLRADFARYSRSSRDEDEADFADDSGWKQVHSEVFRVPPHHVLLCALVGTGSQLTLLSFAIIFIAIASVVYTSRGGLLTYGVLSWAATSAVAGYSSATMFTRMAAIGPAISRDWVRAMAYTALIFPGTVAATIFALNVLALSYNAQNVIPVGTMLGMLCLWFLVSTPLVVLGTMLGRHTKARHEVPRVSQIPRRIPEKWYLRRPAFIAAGGVLPFGSIFIELYFVFTSFWNYKFYYVYGFMLLVFVILLIVTACVAVVGTYVLLNAEDYRWPWTAYLLSASTSVYIFLYATYFFLFKTKMSGFFMTVFYFGYMLLFCFGFALLCGTVGYAAADAFVRRIYRGIKLD